MEEEEYRPLKKGSRVDDGYQPDSSYGDPYLRDENGRPVGILKTGAHAPRTRRTQGAQLKTFTVLGTVFSIALIASGQVVPGIAVAGSTLFVAIMARLRR
jgi:hypothetical protein